MAVFQFSRQSKQSSQIVRDAKIEEEKMDSCLAPDRTVFESLTIRRVTLVDFIEFTNAQILGL